MSPIGVYMRVEARFVRRGQVASPIRQQQEKSPGSGLLLKDPPFDLFSMYAPTVMSGNTIGNSLGLSSIILTYAETKKGTLYETRITVRSEILQ